MEKVEKQAHVVYHFVETIDHECLNALRGGTADADPEYEVVIIDGQVYIIKRNSAGQIIEMQPI